MCLSRILASLCALVLVKSSGNVLKDYGKCDQPSVPYYTSNEMFSSRKDGTYMIHALMRATNGEPCQTLTTGGLIRVQAIKYAIKTRRVAHNLSIGYQIDDSCFNLPKIMARGIEIVRAQEQQTCYKTNTGVCPLSQQKKHARSGKDGNTVLAVIGGYFSFTTIPLSSLLSAFSIPVSYTHLTLPTILLV